MSKRLTVAVVALMLAGCSSGIAQEDFDALQAERDRLAQQVPDLQAERDRLAQQVQDLQAQLFAATSTTTTTAPPTHTITGTLLLLDAGIRHRGRTCWGTGGFDDMNENAQVVIRDGNGNTLATGHLQPGEVKSTVECVFAFEVAGVRDAEFYSVEVSHRGELSYARADLEASGWVVSLTLG